MPVQPAIRNGVIAAVFALSLCRGALADGKVFAVRGAAARIPDQQALVHFADGVETLVIETRFQGTGGEFAWVVPLPSLPSVEPATTGLFPTLRSVFTPRVASATPWSGWVFFWCAAFVVVAMRGPERLWGFVALTCIALAWLVLFLPGLGRSRGVGAAAGAPDIHARRTVGAFETVTLSGGGPVVVEWLNANGFGVDPADEAAIEAYAREGWVFVASRLRDDAGDGAVTPHPLCFRFATERAVYPLRLTALAGGPVSIDLYVFGTGRASAPGFQVARCSATGTGSAVRSPAVMLDHSELKRLASGAPTATKLMATLTPAEMARDAAIEFGPFRATGGTIYSDAGAVIASWNVGAGVLLAGVLAMAGVLALRGRRAYERAGRLAIPIAGGCAAGVVCSALLPVGPVDRASRPWRENPLHWSVRIDLAGEVEALGASAGGLTLEAMQGMARAAYERAAGDDDTPREEDSPGNYTIRRNGRAFEHVSYNWSGAEDVWPIWP